MGFPLCDPKFLHPYGNSKEGGKQLTVTYTGENGNKMFEYHHRGEFYIYIYIKIFTLKIYLFVELVSASAALDMEKV